MNLKSLQKFTHTHVPDPQPPKPSNQPPPRHKSGTDVMLRNLQLHDEETKEWRFDEDILLVRKIAKKYGLEKEAEEGMVKGIQEKVEVQIRPF